MFNKRPRLDRRCYVGEQRYFVTFCTDGRHPAFKDLPQVATVLEKFLLASAERAFEIIAYVFMPDDNRDDAPDKKEILLTGFGGFDHAHGLPALVAGPDGRWYFNAGNAGPHIVTDRAGWTLRAVAGS